MKAIRRHIFVLSKRDIMNDVNECLHMFSKKFHIQCTCPSQQLNHFTSTRKERYD